MGVVPMTNLDVPRIIRPAEHRLNMDARRDAKCISARLWVNSLGARAAANRRWNRQGAVVANRLAADRCRAATNRRWHRSICGWSDRDQRRQSAGYLSMISWRDGTSAVRLQPATWSIHRNKRTDSSE
jgi:hypothetical protein